MIGKLITVVYGMDEQDSHTKSQLIEMCKETADVSREQSLMVGDRIHDQNGAKSYDVDFQGEPSQP